MAAFLKIVSGIYLAFVWLVFVLVLKVAPMPADAAIGSVAPVIAFLAAVVLSIPAVAMFAFGQLVGDIRVMRNHARMQSDHLQAMRAYYEPR